MEKERQRQEGRDGGEERDGEVTGGSGMDDDVVGWTTAKSSRGAS